MQLSTGIVLSSPWPPPSHCPYPCCIPSNPLENSAKSPARLQQSRAEGRFLGSPHKIWYSGADKVRSNQEVFLPSLGGNALAELGMGAGVGGLAGGGGGDIGALRTAKGKLQGPAMSQEAQIEKQGLGQMQAVSGGRGGGSCAAEK